MGQKLGDCVAELRVRLGNENVLTIDNIEALDGKRRRDYSFAGSKRLQHFNAHPAAETEWHDHKGGAIEIGRHIRNRSGHDNVSVGHLAYPGRRLFSDDVQDQFRKARLDPRKDRADETHGGVRVRRMPEVSDEEQARRRVPKGVERMFRKRHPERDPHNWRVRRETRKHQPVTLGERDDGLDLPDDRSFKPLPGTPTKPIRQPREAAA